MIDRKVYVGPYNNEKSDILFNKVLKYLKENKGDRFYYILPNGKLLTKYRRRILSEVGQTFNINLFTFDNIVDRLLDNSFYTIIDDESKEALLVQILEDLREEDKIRYYKDISFKKGFAQSLSSIIGEIKRSLVRPEDFLEKCPDSPFYNEIGFIYEEYQNRLKELQLLDREECFLKSLEILKEDNRFFDGLDFIVIDYFFDFRPQEMEILKEIAKTQLPIYINMPFDRGDNFNSFTETIEILKSLGFTIEKVDKEVNNYYEELADQVFAEDDSEIEKSKDIHIIKAANIYLELKKISEKIKSHYRNGIDLEDMAIVLTNTDKYKDRLFQVFDEEKIPINMNNEIRLSQIPILQELIFILKVKRDHMDKNSIINRIKSNYFPLCPIYKREAFEYILRKEDSNSYMKDELEELLNSIEDEIKIIPEKASLSEFVKVTMDILERYKVGEGILDIYNKTNDYELLNRDISAIAEFKEILNKVDMYLSNIYNQIKIDEFIDILERYLENETIVKVEANMNGVNILTPVTARGQNVKVLFVLGMAQEDYPNIGNRNFFFKEDNYRSLKKIGIDIKSYYEELDKQSLMFSIVLSSSSDQLYLSYSQNSDEDENSLPSMFLDEVLNRIQGEEIEDKVELINVNMDYILKDRNTITTKDELSRYILSSYMDGEYDKELFYMFNDIDNNTFRQINSNIRSEYERNKDEFNEYSGLIDDKEVNKDIEESQKKKIYSISYLESYGKCPYYFMLNNILRVEEMERAFEDFTPLDRGSVNHELLKDYYYNFQSNIKDYITEGKEFNVDKTYDYILNKVEEKIYSLTSNTNSPLWRLRIENNANKLLDFIKKDMERLSNLDEKVVPYEFEAPFGRDGRFELDIDDRKIPFTGIIDRIDKYVDEDKYIVIDYKNSPAGVKKTKDMEKGTSLQLPIYMLSQEDKHVESAMYGVINSGKFEIALTDRELSEIIDRTKDHIKSYIESIQQGDFSIDPKECSDHCIYKDICRYKKSLEVM